MLKEKLGGGGKMGVLLTKVKSGIRPTDVEIYNGSNTYVNQGIIKLHSSWGGAENPSMLLGLREEGQVCGVERGQVWWDVIRHGIIRDQEITGGGSESLQMQIPTRAGM